MEMFAYWSEHPPLHLMIAAFLGVRGAAPSPRAARAEEQAIAALMERPQRMSSVPQYVRDAIAEPNYDA